MRRAEWIGILAVIFAVISIGLTQQRHHNSLPNMDESDAAVLRKRQLTERHLLHKQHLESTQALQKGASQSTNGTFSVLGRWAWGPCTTVELTGRYALVGQGFVYQVFDVSNPAAPTLVYDTTLSMPISHIEIRDTVLFIVLSRSVLFCDASSLFPLVEHGRLNPTAGFLQGMAVSDTLLFLMADYAGVLAYSIADISTPVSLLQYGGAGEYGESAIASSGPYVYYAPLGPGEYLHILKYVPDSANFATSGLDVGGMALTANVYDTLMVTSGSVGDVRVFSITDPWNPQLLGIANPNELVWAVAKKDNRLYCSTDSAVVIIDISAPSNPVVTARYLSPNSWAGSLVLKDSLLAGSGSGFKLYTLSSPDQLEGRFYYPTGGFASSIQMRKNIGFIGSGAAGLWSVDFSDPAHPRPLRNLRSNVAYQLALTRNLACYLTSPLAPAPAQLIVAQVSDSGSMSLLSTTDFGYDVGLSITATDSMVFVGFTDSVIACRITNPMSPQKLWRWTLNNHAENHLSASGHYLYVAQRGGSDRGGIQVLDVSNPDTPRVVSSLLSNVLGVFATDGLVLAAADTGFCIINAANPSTPAFLGSTKGLVWAPVVQAGRFAYANGNGVQVFDINDPNHPTFVGSSAGIATGQINDISTSGNNVFVASSSTGAWVLNNTAISSITTNVTDRPTAFRLFQNYPNPFNPSTTILYSIPESGSVTLRIYDLLGRQVAQVVNESERAGSYRVTWYPDRLASGVYFYRLQAGSFVQTKQLLLLR